MIRPFDWRDLPLLRRVAGRGLCLAAQIGYTRGPHALTGVIVDAFSGGRSPATLVVRSDGLAGIGQLQHRPGEPHARLVLVAPADLMEAGPGSELLDALARSAGERGAHHLIAEVDEDSPAFESLRRAGYAIYARQRIWKLAPAPSPSPPASPANSSPWRAEAASDLIPIRSLSLTLIPPLVQQIEPPAARPGSGVVYWPDDELHAYLEIERGPLGIWIQPYFHPAVQDAGQLLAAFLAGGIDSRRRPVYACVRSYQSWMNGALERLRFVPAGDQAVMVRRMAVPLREAAPAIDRALAGARAEPTAPIAHLAARSPRLLRRRREGQGTSP